MNKISKTEDILYEIMLGMGLKPERQYPISKMKVDFAFPKEKLVVEVDGEYKRNAEGMKSLFERRIACENEGWRVVNFISEEVYKNPEKIAWRISHMLNNQKEGSILEFFNKKKEFNIKDIDVLFIEWVSQQRYLRNYIGVDTITKKFKEWLDSSEEWINSRFIGRMLKRLKLYCLKRRVGKGIEVLLDVKKAELDLKELKSIHSS